MPRLKMSSRSDEKKNGDGFRRPRSLFLAVLYPSVLLWNFEMRSNQVANYGADRVKTTGRLYTPGALLGCVKPAAHTVLKKA